MTILLNVVVAIPCDEDDEICKHIEEIVRKRKTELAKRLTKSTIVFLVEKLVESGVLDKKSAYRLLRKYLARLG